MGIFDKLKKAPEVSNYDLSLGWNNIISQVNGWLGNQQLESDMSDVTYYTCVKILSESVAKLRIVLKDVDNNIVTNHPVLSIINTAPNEFMNPTTLKMVMEYHRNEYGNAYAYLRYTPRGKLLGIYPLHPRQVKIYIDDVNLFNTKDSIIYEYTDDRGQIYKFSSKEILHLKGGLSAMGLIGISVKETLAANIDGSKQAQNYLNKLFENGLTAKAILTYTGDLDSKKKKMLLDQMESYATRNNGNFLPLPMGMDIKPLDLKLSDSQFYELKKFSALQIASAFGIKPNFLNDYEAGVSGTSEAQTLAFYTDTLMYVLKHYEEELNRKLLTSKELANGYHFEFNIHDMLKADVATQADAMTKLLGGSIYTVNEARKQIGLPAVESGDDIIWNNGASVKLDQLGSQYGLDTTNTGGGTDGNTNSK